MNRCLYCYQVLGAGQVDFHSSCSRKMFGSATPPELPYSEEDISKLALQFIQQRVSVTGVQPKLSLDITSTKEPKKLTIVGLWGNYILKPPSNVYQSLPEIEDLVMHLAALCGISTVPHSLIRLKSGSLAYITKRIDRSKSDKHHMEDMCQLTERMTEHKYAGSHEQIAKAILKYSANPVLDVINFYELTLFCYLTGNADMHLKNFSLIDEPGIGYHLSPAYDLLCTAVANPADKEELALTLNGKKRKITLTDFKKAMTQANISSKVMDGIFSKYKDTHVHGMLRFIYTCFLPDELKQQVKEFIQSRSSKFFR
ncbi:MAG: HipA domain-containing protein [Cytophagales bacterium]|nr:HipA domain-containing protein [Cytophagales bacterium]